MFEPPNSELHLKWNEAHNDHEILLIDIKWNFELRTMLDPLKSSKIRNHDRGAKDYTKTRTKVGFYGNDGVCLFKYFIRKTDPQSAFVWSILVLNFICFVFISLCYIYIGILSMRSSARVGATSRNDKKTRQRNRRMNQRITIIIASDFICWVPFIVICTLHYAEVCNASEWYSILSMVVLPINSLINPLLYDDIIMKKTQILLYQTSTRINGTISVLRRALRLSKSSHVLKSQQDAKIQETQM